MDQLMEATQKTRGDTGGKRKRLNVDPSTIPVSLSISQRPWAQICPDRPVNFSICLGTGPDLQIIKISMFNVGLVWLLAHAFFLGVNWGWVPFFDPQSDANLAELH